ncbi:hypothetical protein L596_021720 [Steinernema carpocapsae]|uniref:Uncharacterized protein n=1 Tax=Steinernema carpocapsae TaxID=34508 RepID=A0A4U5MJK1_STECR|nr:hypothetical protein L596_021720 [Steinernema carpocapsae]
MARATSGRQSVLTRKVNALLTFVETSRNETKPVTTPSISESEASRPNTVERLATIRRHIAAVQKKISAVEDERETFDAFIDQLSDSE